MGNAEKGQRGQIILSAPEAGGGTNQAYAEIFGIKYSPLSRKIVTFNLVALCLMMTGILYLNQIDDDLIRMRERVLETDARYVSEMLSTRVNPAIRDGQFRPEMKVLFARMVDNNDAYAQLYDTSGTLVAYSDNLARSPSEHKGDAADSDPGGISDQVLNRLTRLFSGGDPPSKTAAQWVEFTRLSTMSALEGNLRRSRSGDENGNLILAVALPIIQDDRVIGAIVMSSQPGEIDAIVRDERSQILRIFFLAMMINIILSVALANTIAHPLQDLAEAADKGGAMNTQRLNPERIEFPDLTGRPDEIGYLAGAMKSMTTALYDRIEANETFAADVAHEIKNPLTSLRSAVDTMKYAKDDEGRAKLLAVITQDVMRLDRLVTDISNASRLDSELVRDELANFDIRHLLSNLVEYNQELADQKQGRLVADLPTDPLMVSGLEGRLAQVFVNLITNAISFMEPDGEVRVKVRELGSDKVRVTVEDTGPGIPDENLEDVFSRFYSNRPGQEFGNHSGLGLAISKQIVDAHRGAIWAENLRPPGAGPDTPPSGARFTVDLPK